MPSHTCCRSMVIASSRWSLESDASPFKIYSHSLPIMNTSPTPPTTTCPLVQENGTEIISPPGSELTSISLDVEKANNDASSSAVDASPKAKTMKEVLFKCGRGLAVSVVIALALAGKGFVARAHNDPPGTDDMMRNADFSKDSSKQVALLDLEGDGNNVAGYDLTKVDGGVSTVRTLEQAQDPIIYDFTKVGDGACRDSNNNDFDLILFRFIADVDACKAQCAQCPGQGQAADRELRGIYYFTASRQCSCLLDDGGLFDKAVCPGAIYRDTTKTGTGAICLFPASGRECWKHKVEVELVNVRRARWQHGVRMNIYFGWIVGRTTSGSMDSHSKCSKLAI
eukprot:scaffold6143_cov147-Skeletonema_dohrnii-CCMP3373.AAC.14